MSVLDNSEFLWNFVQERAIDKLSINIQNNAMFIEPFKQILQTTYNNRGSFSSQFEMNKHVVNTCIDTFSQIINTTPNIEYSAQPVPQIAASNSRSNTNTNTNTNTQLQKKALLCKIDTNNKVIHHENMGLISTLCCKSIELFNVCLSETTNELDITNKHYLHEHMTLLMDVIINNKRIAENVIITQQYNQNNDVLLFTSTEQIAFNDICSKLEFVFKDTQHNILSMNHTIKIQTMIAGYMLTVPSTITQKLREPTFFSFIIEPNTYPIHINDLIQLNEKTLKVLGTGTISITGPNNINVTDMSNESYNAFFCKLDNKFKLPNSPDKINLINTSRCPTICIEYA